MKLKRSAPFMQRLEASQVDASNGVLKGVVILEEGYDKYKDYFDPVSLQQLVTLGNSQPQGVKSRFGHPNMCESALGSYIGRYKNYRLATVDVNGSVKKAVLADLYLDKTANNSPKGKLYDYTLEMAQKNADMFGNSICYFPGEQEEIEIDGLPVMAERIESHPASDVVDSPAATTSLFKDFKTSKDFASIATEFLDENPELANIILKNENSLTDFITKYKTTMANTKKTFKEKVKEKLDAIAELFKEEKKDITANTMDGTTVNISDADNSGIAAVGDVVSDATGAPMADATLPMEDGTTIHTDATGAITAIDPAGAGDGTATQAAAEVAKSVDDYKKLLADEITAHNEDNELAEKTIDDLTLKLKAEQTKLKDAEARLVKYKSEFVPDKSKNVVGKKKEEPAQSAEERKAAMLEAEKKYKGKKQLA